MLCTNTYRVCSSMLLGVVVLLVAGCGSSDPGALGPAGVDGGLSVQGQKQEYVDGASRALTQLGSAQGDAFARAVDGGAKRPLQAAALAWKQGDQQLKELNPPKEAAVAHQRLVKAVDSLAVWNDRLVAAAPNPNRTRTLAKQAAGSAASKQFGDAICALVDLGYEVVDSGVCTPLADPAAASPIQ